MQCFKLIYEKDFDGLIEELEEMREYFKSRHIEIGIAESMEDKTHFINIYFPDKKIEEKALNIFHHHIGSILYKALIEEFDEKCMIDFITEAYFFLNEDELRDVRIKSLNILNNDKLPINDNNIFYINRKNELIDKIIECIADKNEINIKGFLTFRMKPLRDEIEKIIDKIVEEYLIEKEYNEFIKLLKYFVEIQDSRIELVNIIIKEDGNYSVLDGEGNNIMDEFAKDFINNQMASAINVEDILISGLIAYCPEKIVIHGSKNSRNNEIINTIKNVFLNRVSFCENCKICFAPISKRGVKR